jgi:hypothetical protein
MIKQLKPFPALFTGAGELVELEGC